MAQRATASNGTRARSAQRTASAEPTGRQDNAPPPAERNDAPDGESCVISPRSRTGRAVTGLKSAGSAVRDSVAGHPVPAVLIGAGLAWLLVESRRKDREAEASSSRRQEASGAGDEADAHDEEQPGVLGRAAQTYREVSQRYANGRAKEVLSTGVHRVGERLSDAAQSVRGGAARVGEYAQEGARSVGAKVRRGAVTVGAKVRGGAAAVGEGARKGYESTREGASKVWHEHPLTTGLAAFATGVAVGMFLPGTRRENDMMGRRSDALSQRVRDAASTYFDRGKDAAASTVETIKEEAQDVGLAPEQVARKVRRIATHVQEAAVGAVSSGGAQASSGARRNGTQARRKK